jgi:signal transduction histidine kinase
VTIRIGCLPNAAGFYVEDDGPGIPPEKRSDVVQAGYTESENGTGFGLSIVNQIVDGHDWQLDITEGDDGGARFEISNTK